MLALGKVEGHFVSLMEVLQYGLDSNIAIIIQSLWCYKETIYIFIHKNLL